MKPSIHNYEPEDVIADEAKELLQGECDPFNFHNFLHAVSDAIYDIKNRDALEHALHTCDTAEVGRIVVNAVENYYANLAQHMARERYYNHELDDKYEE